MSAHLLSHAAHLSDNQLIAKVKAFAHQERSALTALVAHLAVLDERRLYLGEGFSSLFAYCTHVLHLSEHATYNRIEAARAARRFPVILDRLAAGDIHLTAVRLLAPHLTEENHVTLLDEARHLKMREVEEIVARLQPRPSVPSTIRRLPAPGASTPPAADGTPHADLAMEGVATPMEGAILGVGGLSPSRRAVVEPLSPGQFRVQFTADGETRDKLHLAPDLLRHRIPDGALGKVIKLALTALLNELAKQKYAATDRPRASANAGLGIPAGSAEGVERGAGSGAATNAMGAGGVDTRALEGCARPTKSANPAISPARSRYIPAAIKREVWTRDGGRCAFVAADGRRCPERGCLEFHHVQPYTAGGAATSDNIQLRCRSHNGYEAQRHFGIRVSYVREPTLACAPSFCPSSYGVAGRSIYGIELVVKRVVSMGSGLPGNVPSGSPGGVGCRQEGGLQE